MAAIHIAMALADLSSGIVHNLSLVHSFLSPSATSIISLPVLAFPISWLAALRASLSPSVSNNAVRLLLNIRVIPGS